MYLVNLNFFTIADAFSVYFLICIFILQYRQVFYWI